MTTSIDSNVLIALWRKSQLENRVASEWLGEARRRGKLVVCAPVYAELIADPNRSEKEVDAFASETGISVDWLLEERIWRAAGKAYGGYAQRRLRSGGGAPRRILADFPISALAVQRGYVLLTFNTEDYVAAFPRLQIFSL
jgi:predicted nucleic acid-binding protein